MLINFNGQTMAPDHPILYPTNRAFRYGDGMFESIRVLEGKMPFLPYHWQRFSMGIKLLRLSLPAHFTLKFLQTEIEKLTNAQGNWRVRLTIWRTGAGLYTPSENGIEYLVEAMPLTSSFFELNAVGLAIGIYDQSLLPCQSQVPNLGSFKTTAALPYVLASSYKQEKGWDDCLMMNTKGRLACATNANIFWIRNNTLSTPRLEEGCIAGTMRQTLLDLAPKIGLNCEEKTLSMAELGKADEVFLTNAIQGIRWVNEIKPLANMFGHELAMVVNQELGKLLVAS